MTKKQGRLKHSNLKLTLNQAPVTVALSDSDLSEAKQDLSFHHTPEAANIDWLSWTKGSSTPLTLCRKRSLGLDIH
jgi:hypothetical protein